MKKLEFLFLLSAILIGIALSLSPIFRPFEYFMITKYLDKKGGKSDKLIVVTLKPTILTEDKLWPWGSKWSNYLITYLLDLRPQKLILGPNFLNHLKNSLSLKEIFKDPNVLIPFTQRLSSSGVKFSGHMMIDKKNGYLVFNSNWKNLPPLELTSSVQYSIKKRDFYFIPQKAKVKIFSASDIALKGFLKTEGYKDADLKEFKKKIIFLEEKSPQLDKEIAFLLTQLNSTAFIILPKEFVIYLGIFLFVILYILVKPLKFEKAIPIFIISIGLCFLLHRFYFNLQKNYIELSPIISFVFLAFLTSILNQQYELRSYRKIKREMQMASLLKEKEILPHSVLSSDGIIVSVTRYKTGQVGGDFYQFLEFAKGELGIMIGWVPGKGMNRIKHIMEVVHSWRDFASIYKEPGKVMQVLNNSLFKYAEEAKYTTLTYLLYQSRRSTLKYVNAGHDPLIYLNNEGKIKVIEVDDPTPLGIARDVPFQEYELKLNPSDTLFGYSGGISQIISETGGLKEDFLESLRQYLFHRPEELADEVFNEILQYYPKKPQEEWSLMILKITE